MKTPIVYFALFPLVSSIAAAPPPKPFGEPFAQWVNRTFKFKCFSKDIVNVDYKDIKLRCFWDPDQRDENALWRATYGRNDELSCYTADKSREARFWIYPGSEKVMIEYVEPEYDEIMLDFIKDYTNVCAPNATSIVRLNNNPI